MRSQWQRSLRVRIICLIAPIASLLLATYASAVEHPGVIPADAVCSSCHANKISGKSVHSAMATSCTVCHVAKTQGDMTTLNLSMPKAQICFACHEQSAALLQHKPTAKKQCMECHDAHSSNRAMLLRAEADVLAIPRP